MDVGLLIVRLVVGGLLVGHGVQKLFGWFSGHGVRGTGQFFEVLGYRPGRPMAILAGLSEAGGGLLLATGTLTPLGAAAIAGVLLNALVSVHRPKGMWNTNGGMEFPLTLISAALAIAFTGPGRYALDQAIGWQLSGLGWGLAASAIALVAAVSTLTVRKLSLRAPARAAEVVASDDADGVRTAA
jgi:putative oxidoreductase